MAKASITRNYRFPTLNDLYFLPGGNPALNNESGFTYETGLSFSVGKDNVYTLSGSASWFDQHIDDRKRPDYLATYVEGLLFTR